MNAVISKYAVEVSRKEVTRLIGAFRSDQFGSRSWQVYLFAIAATVATLALRLALDGPLRGEPTLVIFIVPIMLSAYVGGLRAGLLATGLSYFLASHYLLPPLHSLLIASDHYRWQQFVVVLAGVVISILNEALHRARRQANLATSTHQEAEEAMREDITERKRAEEELSVSREALRELNTDLEQRVAQRTEDLFAATQEAERANRAKSEFLSRTSHELRTPLNAILGFGQLLEMEENLGAEPRESVEQILQAAHHLLSLINEVLDISNAESGSMTLSLEPVAVDQLVKETLSLIGSLDKTLQLDVEEPSPLECGWKVLADPQRLKQVLLNLLSNAIKYNRPGGKVTVEFAPTETDPPAFRLSVRDTGPGISPEKVLRLFTPFDRLDAERTKTHIVGTGLGLTLSKRMIELMGGRIGMESVVGEGSTFWVELPLAESPGAPSDENALASIKNLESQIQNSNRLLYIEDNVSNVRLITRILARRPDTELLSAETGGLGLSMALEHRPDLILLDLHLPDLDGDEVLTRLRADPRTSEIPVVMLSADSLPETRKRMLAGGARAFLTKPVEVRRLLGVIDQFIEFTPEEIP